MIRLFYSGATAPDKPQPVASKSLGGYRSTSVIPNNRANSLFSDLSVVDVQSSAVRTLAVFVSNVGIAPYYNIRLGNSQSAGAVTTVTFAVTEVNSAEAPHFMDSIERLSDEPYDANFYDLSIDPEEGGGAVICAALLPGESVGIWLRQQVNRPLSLELDKMILELEGDLVTEVHTPPASEELKLILEYDLTEPEPGMPA